MDGYERPADPGIPGSLLLECRTRPESDPGNAIDPASSRSYP